MRSREDARAHTLPTELLHTQALGLAVSIGGLGSIGVLIGHTYPRHHLCLRLVDDGHSGNGAAARTLVTLLRVRDFQLLPHPTRSRRSANKLRVCSPPPLRVVGRGGGGGNPVGPSIVRSSRSLWSGNALLALHRRWNIETRCSLFTGGEHR
jgi:hypothetical protein